MTTAHNAPLTWRVDRGVGILTLNRPDRLNAFDAAMAEAWTGACRALVDDPDVRAIVLRGEGRAFCAGGDLAALGAAVSTDLAALAKSYVEDA